jgi:hypothetical protein
MMDDIQYTRIVLTEAERQANEMAALCRGRLDQLYKLEHTVSQSRDKVINPKLLRKWREETGL